MRMQGESHKRTEGSEIDLALLSDRLVMEGMPIQRVIGEEAHVSQSTVSRAIHGKIIGHSKGARRLWTYAEERFKILKKASPQTSSEDRSPASSTQSPAVPRRSPRHPRLTGGVGRTHATGENRRMLEERAIRGLQDYLEDRFDPQLVIEQLAVLRRAQDHGRAYSPRSDRSGRPG